MVERSLMLQQMLRAAGYTKRDGVATAGIRLVSRLAKQHRMRDWPHTRSVEDYDALIEVVKVHLAERVVPPNDPSSATRPTRAFDCNRDAMAGFAAAHG